MKEFPGRFRQRRHDSPRSAKSIKIHAREQGNFDPVRPGLARSGLGHREPVQPELRASLGQPVRGKLRPRQPRSCRVARQFEVGRRFITIEYAVAIAIAAAPGTGALRQPDEGQHIAGSESGEQLVSTHQAAALVIPQVTFGKRVKVKASGSTAKAALDREVAIGEAGLCRVPSRESAIGCVCRPSKCKCNECAGDSASSPTQTRPASVTRRAARACHGNVRNTVGDRYRNR